MDNRFETFKLLYGTLGELRSSALDYALKTTAGYLIVIGWLVTADEARDFLKGKLWIGILGTTVLLTSAGIYCILNSRGQQNSVEIGKEIAALNIEPAPPYKHRLVTSSAAWMLNGGELFLSVVAAALLLAITGKR